MNPKTDPIGVSSILLVEDDSKNLKILAEIIPVKYPNIVLHSAINGRIGLELFKMHTPDIVITDFNMPELSGLQMADKIRAIKPDAKIIVLTGNDKKAALESAVGEGFEIDHYIMKPVNFGQLFAAIEQCLGEIKQQMS